MAVFASPEWIDELDEAARRHDELAAVTADVRLAVTQVITDTGGGDGAVPTGAGRDGQPPGVQWTLTIDRGSVRVRPGPAAATVSIPRVRFTADAPTAAAIARGDLAPQDALAAGRLRVGGDLDALRRHRAALAAVDDVFAEVRAGTTWPLTPARRGRPSGVSRPGPDPGTGTRGC